jgi:hypothetical protein
MGGAAKPGMLKYIWWPDAALTPESRALGTAVTAHAPVEYTGATPSRVPALLDCRVKFRSAWLLPTSESDGEKTDVLTGKPPEIRSGATAAFQVATPVEFHANSAVT